MKKLKEIFTKWWFTGKSDIVDTYCKEKGIQMIDLRLGTQEVGDLVGIPRSKKNLRRKNENYQENG